MNAMFAGCFFSSLFRDMQVCSQHSCIIDTSHHSAMFRSYIVICFTSYMPFDPGVESLTLGAFFRSFSPPITGLPLKVEALSTAGSVLHSSMAFKNNSWTSWAVRSRAPTAEPVSTHEVEGVVVQRRVDPTAARWSGKKTLLGFSTVWFCLHWRPPKWY